jgi:hypothetical protein
MIGAFVSKLLSELEAIDQACVLVNNDSGTQWCQPLYENCSAFFLPKGRIQFINADRGNTVSSVVFYFGRYVDRFAEAFSQLGGVLLAR